MELNWHRGVIIALFVVILVFVGLPTWAIFSIDLNFAQVMLGVAIGLACLTAILLGIFILAVFGRRIRCHRKHSIGRVGCLWWVSLAFWILGVVWWSALVIAVIVWWLWIGTFH